MSVHDNIRLLRKVNRFSQEYMAERLNISLNSYARIERGETKLNLDKLVQIARILNVDEIELMTMRKKSGLFLSNPHLSLNFAGGGAVISS